jgi:hypothetical protein
MRSARFTRLLVLALLMLCIPAASFAGVFVSITVAPPPIPVYVQPPCPEPGYMWTPGYWAWGDEGYYWVPGTWVPAPAVGLLWTPGYWGWVDGYYRWNAGYWGPHVGFYGGINYGFGYGGVGFFGGEWRHGGFYYNRAVVNVNETRITNVYVNKTVIVNNTTVNRVSYNGGTGGTVSRPTPMERQAASERHIQPTAMQTQHETAAARNPQLFAKNNAGKPAIAATVKPADFSARSVVAARAAGGRVEPATMNASARSMPPAVKSPTAAPRPAANTNPAQRNQQVARPPSAYSQPQTSGNMPANRNSGQYAARPPANNARTTGNSQPQPSGMTQRNQPQTRSNPPQGYSQQPAQQPRVQNSAPRYNPPAQQQHVQAPAPHNNPPAHNAPQSQEKAPNEHERR